MTNLDGKVRRLPHTDAFIRLSYMSQCLAAVAAFRYALINATEIATDRGCLGRKSGTRRTKVCTWRTPGVRRIIRLVTCGRSNVTKVRVS
jgi:hypothetical protein